MDICGVLLIDRHLVRKHLAQKPQFADLPDLGLDVLDLLDPALTDD